MVEGAGQRKELWGEGGAKEPRADGGSVLWSERGIISMQGGDSAMTGVQELREEKQYLCSLLSLGSASG